MHFIVDDIALACAAVARSGGEVAPAVETPHGVVAEVLDTEGNTFTLRQPRVQSQSPHAA
jgi:predicted enzyme related to lactoylglutathione lyase